MEKNKLGRWEINYENRTEFLELKKEIWTNGLYYFEEDEDEENINEPLIIDAGAHIGMATMYWLGLFPKAKIWAIEPNPNLVEILDKNVIENTMTNNVIVVNKALAEESGWRNFFVDETKELSDKWQMTGSLIDGGWTGKEKTARQKIETIKLSEVIEEIWNKEKRKIDLLKIDIEGMEEKVLNESKDWLSKINRVFLEFHPRKRGNNWENIVKIMRNAGFSFEEDSEKEKRENANKLRIVKFERNLTK